MKTDCAITKRKLKRKPEGSGVYRNGTWAPCYPGSKAYRFIGEEIQREPKHLFTIMLIQTSRANGKSEKDRFPVAQLEYWEIVEDFLEGMRRRWYWQKDILRINEGKIIDGLRQAVPNTDQAGFESLLKLVLEKLGPVKKYVIEDYMRSEEYPLQVLKIKNERNRPGDEEKTKRPDQGEQVRRERCDRVLKDMVSFKSISNKNMAVEIVNAGYRKMAPKYHPDNGGDLDDMRQLNEVKGEMLRLLGTN